MRNYSRELEIRPLCTPPQLRIRVPGSKSITNRALILAALTQPGMQLHAALRSEDTEIMIECLRELGWLVETDWAEQTISVFRPSGLALPKPSAQLFVGNSGTTIRFLTAMLALARGEYILDGIPRMRERPIQDLLDALRQLGVDAESMNNNGCPPVRLRASGVRDGTVRVKVDVSSQYLSGLLLALPFADNETLVLIEGTLVSEPYIEMTLRMLEDFGLVVHREGAGRFRVPGRQQSMRYAGKAYTVEPDASSASYFLAAAAIGKGTVFVEGLTENSLQGDVQFVEALEQMGCEIDREADGIGVRGGKMRGISIDMNAISDTVMTLAAVACFAEGPTHIRNVAHIRHKETDRLAALATELRKLGVGVEEHADGLTIHPQPLKGCAVDTYNDHRMAMSLALIGLRIPEVIIRDPGCVRKTYPGYWEDFERLRGA